MNRLLAHFHQHPSVCTDTRKLKPGDIFIALHGPRFDGNLFAAQALEQGAALAVVDKEEYFPKGDTRYVLVPDTLQALQQLAHQYRKEFEVPFIGITGSNGKTTTKELIHAVLSSERKTFATQGNLNNHIGVPLTLLSIPQDTEIAVVEMGANQPGDIRELVEIAHPTHGLITNIGAAHLERFGDLDGVQQTKGELFDFLREHQGHIFLNEGDKRVVAASQDGNPMATFGGPDSDYRIKIVRNHLEGMELQVFLPGESTPRLLSSRLSGNYNAQNILAAIGVGHQLGISWEGISQGVGSYVPSNNRSQIVRKGAHTYWLDAYNANPNSMRASIRNVFEFEREGVVLVLGDMLELGPEAENLHADMGRFINGFAPMLTIGVGPLMKYMTDEITGRKQWVENVEELREEWAELSQHAQLILIKGSRGMALERLLEDDKG